MVDTTIDPPNSRLFVLCSKSVTQEDINAAFDKYGHIEDIWIVKDKNTGDQKGVVYIKFSKTSEAALAMEEMNGKLLGNGSAKPIKVMIAHSRDQGARREDDIERLVRLFIVVPKTATADDVRGHFERYGDIDSVNIVKNRETGENKGFAYVKYLRPYHAAIAFEEAPKTYRAVYAKPKDQKPQHNPYENVADRYPINHHSDNSFNTSQMFSAGGPVRLIAAVSKHLLEGQIYRLFDLIPGLDYCRLMRTSAYQQYQKVSLQYCSRQAGYHALDKFASFEYPLGQRIMIKLDMDRGSSPQPLMGGSGGGNSNYGGPPGNFFNDDFGRRDSSSGNTVISNAELNTLTNALAKAESIIKTAGLSQGKSSKDSDGETYDPNYCSVRLPPPQPLARNEHGSERLFIVCQPGLPPMFALRDVFGRFGNLVEVYILQGKNCGYVSYATKESAEKAIETLHLQEVCGMRLKVIKADPPKRPPGSMRDENQAKRARTDNEWD